jgi:hypothetical protein
MAKINFNGQEYDSPEAMPAEVRQLYQMMTNMLADENQDGMPDIFAGSGNIKSTVFQTTQFIVDGKAYSSLDEMPAEMRQKYQQSLGQLDANRNGIPDLLENSPFGTVAQPTPSAALAAAQPFQEPKVTVIGAGLPVNRGTLLIGAAVVLLVLIVALYVINRL